MTKIASSSDHLEAARARLTHLGGLSAHTAAVEGKILESAEARLSVVEQDIATLRPRVNLDGDAAEKYQALVLERGQLKIVIARAGEALS